MLNLTSANFDKEVLKSNKPVLVDFWASWCGPCKKLAPIIDEIAMEYSWKIKFAKVNVDEEPKLAAKYGIDSIPTVILFESGSPLCASIGLVEKERITSMFEI